MLAEHTQCFSCICLRDNITIKINIQFQMYYGSDLLHMCVYRGLGAKLL